MSDEPIPMRLTCPECGQLHVDAGEFATRPHSTHACQHCGHVWRPAVVCTVGVRFLPGFKDSRVGSGENDNHERTELKARFRALTAEAQQAERDGWSWERKAPLREKALELKREWQTLPKPCCRRDAVVDAARVLRKEIEHQGVPSLESCAVLCERLHHLDDQASESGPADCKNCGSPSCWRGWAQQTKCCPDCTCSNPSGVSNPLVEPSERPIVRLSIWKQSQPPGMHLVVSKPDSDAIEFRWRGTQSYGVCTVKGFRQHFTWVSDPTAEEPSKVTLAVDEVGCSLRAELASLRALSAHNEEAARLLRILGDVVYTRHMGGESNVVAVVKWLDEDVALRKDQNADG